MKNLRNYAMLGLAFSLITASCTIQKRSHMKGYHVEWKNGNNKTAVKTNVLDKAVADEETVTAKTEIKEEITLPPTIIREVENTVSAPKVSTIKTAEKIETKSIKPTSKNLKKEIKSNLDISKTAVAPQSFNKQLTTNETVATTEIMRPNSISNGGLLIIIITILIPFLGVLLYEGLGSRFWISLLLTLLFYVPGLIYSLLVVTGTI